MLEGMMNVIPTSKLVLDPSSMLASVPDISLNAGPFTVGLVYMYHERRIVQDLSSGFIRVSTPN